MSMSTLPLGPGFVDLIPPARGGGGGSGAFATVTAPFTMPAVGSNVLVLVTDNTWMAPGEVIFIEGAGYVEVVSLAGTTGVTVKNLGYTGNATPGTVIGIGEKVVPGGLQGPPGIDAFTHTTADFAMPAEGADVTVDVENSSWMVVGQNVFVGTAGYFQVAATPTTTSATLTNLAGYGNAATTTVITAPVGVSPAGVKSSVDIFPWGTTIYTTADSPVVPTLGKDFRLGIEIDTSSGDVTVQLPAHQPGLTVTVRNSSPTLNMNAILLDAVTNGSTIMGEDTAALRGVGSSWTVEAASTGTGWVVT